MSRRLEADRRRDGVERGAQVSRMELAAVGPQITTRLRDLEPTGPPLTSVADDDYRGAA